MQHCETCIYGKYISQSLSHYASSAQFSFTKLICHQETPPTKAKIQEMLFVDTRLVLRLLHHASFVCGKDSNKTSTQATLHNPRVSDEAKQQAELRIDEMNSQVKRTPGKSSEAQQEEARSARETEAKRQINAFPEGINENLDEQEEPLFVRGEEQEINEEDEADETYDEEAARE